MKLIFRDDEYSYQLLRTAGQTAGGGADIGECLAAAYRIRERDDESWYREWFQAAERLHQTAADFLGSGFNSSAAEAFSRASNYYRTAELFLHSNPADPRVIECARKSRDSFIEASRTYFYPVRVVKIPYEDTALPGYLCLVDNSGIKRPLLIMTTGFDGTAEELYFSNAFAALKRGYNCLLFEGPGQGQVMRTQRLPFRPDWENVVKPVVDFAEAQPETDPDAISLMGIGLGGYLAPRACAFEHRIKSCIADGGIYDYHEVAMRNLPSNAESMLDDPAGSLQLDDVIYGLMKADALIRRVFNDGMWKFGAASPSDWLRETRQYTLKDCIDKIKCRMLVVDSENDPEFRGQALALFEALKSPKEYICFTAREGAEEHCQAGAPMISNERIFDWLDATLGGVRQPSIREKVVI